VPTIRSLFNTSSNPMRVFVGVVWQLEDSNTSTSSGSGSNSNSNSSLHIPQKEGGSGGGDGDGDGSGGGDGDGSGDGGGDGGEGGQSAFALWWESNVRHLRMPRPQARGVCWARHLAEGLWQVGGYCYYYFYYYYYYYYYY
jgi:hypothetical protein